MRKVKVLALVLVFAFAALGGAYAMWYDSLFLDTTVETGNVDVKWVSAISSDPGPNYKGECGQGTDVYNGSLDSMEVGNPNSAELKNIGALNCELKDDDEYSDVRAKDDKLEITLTNGYPGYQESVEAGIKNIGTVPVKFRIKAENVPAWLQVKTFLPDKGKEGDQFTALEGYQLDPGDTVLVTIVYLITQDAPQNANASFQVVVKGVQWNEYSVDDSFTLNNIIQKTRIEG